MAEKSNKRPVPSDENEASEPVEKKRKFNDSKEVLQEVSKALPGSFLKDSTLVVKLGEEEKEVHLEAKVVNKKPKLSPREVITFTSKRFTYEVENLTSELKAKGKYVKPVFIIKVTSQRMGVIWADPEEISKEDFDEEARQMVLDWETEASQGRGGLITNLW